MAEHSKRGDEFATLFETITGQTTLIERQQNGIPLRIDGHGKEREIAAYIDTTAKNHGFDDVIEEPE